MEEAPPISGRSDVPAGLLAVLAQMMAKSPDDRFQSPAEVAEAREPFCRDEAPAGEESVFAAVAARNQKKKAWDNTLGGDEPGSRAALHKNGLSTTTSSPDSKR